MKKMNGFSFIEVLMSLLIFSFLILFLDSMGLFALRENHEAYYFSIATHQLNSMAERLRTIHSNTDLLHHLIIWNEQNSRILPEGKGHVISHVQSYTVTIFWGVKTSKRTCSDLKVGPLKCLRIDVHV